MLPLSGAGLRCAPPFADEAGESVTTHTHLQEQEREWSRTGGAQRVAGGAGARVRSGERPETKQGRRKSGAGRGRTEMDEEKP